MKDVLEQLLQLRHNLPSKGEGICLQCPLFGDLDDDTKEELYRSWSHYSDFHLYPVPAHPNCFEGYELHYTQDSLWQREQRELRVSLLNHLIHTIEDSL